MRRMSVVRTTALLSALLLTPLSRAAAQNPRPLGPADPLPKGQQIEAKDGDVVVMRGDARVRMIHRSDANIRALYNSEQRWLLLLIDYADPTKGAPDGAVDATYTFQELGGVWPLGERWDGHAILDDYTMLNTPGGSLGITTDGAFVQLLSGSPALQNRLFADDRAIVLRYNGGGRSNAFPGGPRQTFDEIETRAVTDAMRNAANHGNGVSTSPFDGPGGSTVRTRIGMTTSGGAGVTLSPPPAPRPRAPGEPPAANSPVRVGGNIRQPTKIADAKPVLPAVAAQAGIRGVVILEIVIGIDGAVNEARVLRSIPLLDQAAIDAVKQWRYEVTELNGQPVPVIMTVTVNFS